MSLQFNVAIRAAAPGVTARIIASAPFDISRDRLPPRTRTPEHSDGGILGDQYFVYNKKKNWGKKKKGMNSVTSVNSQQQKKSREDRAEEGEAGGNVSRAAC